MGERRWKDFLSMSVKERNLAVDLFSRIKSELRRHFLLKELGLRNSWDNTDLKAILRLPPEHVAKLLSQKRIKSRGKILRDLRQLDSLMGPNTPIAEGEPMLDTWLEQAAR